MKYGKHKIFLGSSSEALPILRMLVKSIEKHNNENVLVLEPLPWNKYFGEEPNVINSTLLEEFPRILNKCEYSLFILSQDDILIKKNEIRKMTRDNVWFEAGMFMGRRGKDNTFFFINTNERNDIHFPTDIIAMTLQGVKWDYDIARLYFNDNELLKENVHFQNTIKTKLETEIDKYIMALFEKIKTDLENKAKMKQESDEVILISSGEECFNVGIELVKNASTKLYTTIAFSKSLENFTSEEQEMQIALTNKMTENKTIDFQRFMKIDVEGIKKQFEEMQPFVNKKSLLFDNFNFDYLEIIISDDNCLIVMPDYSKPSKQLWEEVAFGIFIENNEKLSNILSAWLLHKVCK